MKFGSLSEKSQTGILHRQATILQLNEFVANNKVCPLLRFLYLLNLNVRFAKDLALFVTNWSGIFPRSRKPLKQCAPCKTVVLHPSQHKYQIHLNRSTLVLDLDALNSTCFGTLNECKSPSSIAIFSQPIFLIKSNNTTSSAYFPLNFGDLVSQVLGQVNHLTPPIQMKSLSAFTSLPLNNNKTKLTI
jgi:hypothetical protein